jgi:hypothetical protein
MAVRLSGHLDRNGAPGRPGLTRAAPSVCQVPRTQTKTFLNRAEYGYSTLPSSWEILSMVGPCLVKI